MKILLLLRHAKSSWDDASLPDFERPLAERGRRDAPRMGKALKDKSQNPDLVISSTAVRARQTIEAFLAGGEFKITPQFDETIYAAPSNDLMRVVQGLPVNASCVLLVGHNPGFEDLLGRLTGKAAHMPTAALGCIMFERGNWNDVKNGSGRLMWQITPKDLGKDRTRD